MASIVYNNNEIAKRLEDFKTLAGWNYSQFADILGSDPASARRYFKGEGNVQSITYYLYYMGCNIAWLYSGEGDMFADNPAGKALRDKNKPAYVSEPFENYSALNPQLASMADEVAGRIGQALKDVFAKFDKSILK